MIELTTYFDDYNIPRGKATYKHKSYAYIYENLLSPFRNTKVTLVELGVSHGGSLQMWKTWLGPQSIIFGLDKEDRLLYEESQIKCFLIDSSKQEDLQRLSSFIPQLDIFIDDGGHVNSEQIAVFETVFPLLNPGGLYFCEDVHTSYRETSYGGGYLKPGTFMEYCKTLSDSLNHLEDTRIPVNKFINEINSIFFYRSMVVIRKIKEGIFQ